MLKNLFNRTPTRRQVRAFWNAQPCLGDQTLEQRNSAFADELAFIMQNFPFESAIDVGCGTGFEPINYRMRGCLRVVGFDQSAASLAIARKRGDFGVEWMLGNAERLPFRDAEFDFASAIGSLHHTPDTERAIAELERVARKEVVIMLYGREWMERWRREHGNAEPNYDNGCPIVKFYTREQLPGLFRRKRIAGISAFADGWAWYVRAVA